jgi:hypothetical protein
MRPEEIGSVMSWNDDDSTAIDVLVDRCASFIQRRGNALVFVHQSAPDYLRGRQGDSILRTHAAYGHREMALSSLYYLKSMLKVNLADLPRPDSTRNAIIGHEGGAMPVQLARVHYAATFWMQHCQDY